MGSTRPSSLGIQPGVPKLPWLVVLRVLVLVALAACAALLSDYVAGSPTFCSASSGCGAVRASPYAHVSLGGPSFVPLPALGLIAFSALYVASLLSRVATLVLAGLGGAIALWLLWVQAFVLGHFCWLCITTDVSAVLAAVAALGLRAPDFRDHAAERLRGWAWWGLGALTVSGPLVWPLVKAGPEVPRGVERYYVPGKLNVVEFADFQCPACRRFHRVLGPVLHKYADRVHFVRLNKPLDMHNYARDAARAAVCGEAQGKLEPTADALFAAQDLSPSGIDRLAKDVGLEPQAFESCMLAPETNARVERESALLVPPDLEGLPTTYIGGKRLLGVRTAEEVEDALAAAERGDGVSGVPGWLFILVWVAAVSGLVLRGRVTLPHGHVV